MSNDTFPTRDDQAQEDQPPLRVTDKRRLDPDSGEVRGGAGATASAPAPAAAAEGVPDAGPEAELSDVLEPDAGDPVTAELIERTEDLRRLKAEYDNYRRRVERDRAGWGEMAVAKVVGDLLPALDDIDRAKAHDALDGTLRAVSEQLEKALTAAGLSRFGATGDVFDPAKHEALTSVPTPGVEVEQVVEVFRSGFDFGGRVLRPAQVVVGTPA